MTDELAKGKERIRQELEEVKNRILGHHQLSAQLELDLLKLRAKPRLFGDLRLPSQEPYTLTAREKFRLSNLSEISHQELGKFIGIRVSDYKHDPLSFVVEITVTNNKGTHVGPYYAAFKKKDNGSYRVIKSRLPHMIIISRTKENFRLENDEQLGKFVRELRLCCQSYVDRKDQYEDLMAVRDKDMVPTVSCDEGYLFIELGIMLNKEGGKLRIFYRHNKILPHKFTLVLKDANAHRTWSKSLNLLYKCSLVEALGLFSVKESPQETELDSDIPMENIPTEADRQSKGSQKSSMKRKSSSEKVKATKEKSTFNFSDSSDDEANRSARMRKKKAKIASNIRRKTYWGALSQQALQESGRSGENTDNSEANSDVSKETLLKTTTDKNAKVTALKKNTQATSLKRVNKKQSKNVAGKIRKVTTPPPAKTDSELSDDESTSKATKSGKEPVLAAIFRKSSAAKRSVGEKLDPKSQPAAKIIAEGKKPLLAAIFQKAKRSLDKAHADLPSSTKKGVATADERSDLTKSRQELALASRELVKSQAKSSKSTESSKSTKETSNKPVESPTKSTVQSDKVKQTTRANKKPSSDEASSSSDLMSGTSKADNSGSMISEISRAASPRKFYRLKPLSQESEPGFSRGRSNKEKIVEEQQPAKKVDAANVSLPKISEVDLLKLSPHKRNASEVSVGQEQSSGREKMVRSSSRPQKGVKSVESSVGTKKGSKKASSEVATGKSPRKKDDYGNAESGVGAKKGSKKASSEVTTGRRQSPRKKDDDKNAESGVGAKKGSKKASSEVATGKSPRKKDDDGNAESGVGAKKGSKKTEAEVANGVKKGKYEDSGAVRKSIRTTKGRKKNRDLK